MMPQKQLAVPKELYAGLVPLIPPPSSPAPGAARGSRWSTPHTGPGHIGVFFCLLICKYLVSYIFSGSQLGQQQEQEHLWRQLRDPCCEGRRDQGTVQDADDIRQDARDGGCRGQLHHISLQECHWNL